MVVVMALAVCLHAKDVFLLQLVIKSAGSVETAMWLWDVWSTVVLHYIREAALLPRQAQHVVWWIGDFRIGGTASSYVGCLAMGCRSHMMSVEWYDGTVRLALRRAMPFLHVLAKHVGWGLRRVHPAQVPV